MALAVTSRSAAGRRQAYGLTAAEDPSMQTTMDRDELIATLNELIETSKDGEQGFTTSAEAVAEAQLREVFLDGARRCGEAARELQTEVRTLGGDPDRSGSVSGALHRGWVEVKRAVTGRDALAVLEEVERGEDAALRAYREALEKPLPPTVRDLVQRQCAGAQANHDRVRALRDTWRAS